MITLLESEPKHAKENRITHARIADEQSWNMSCWQLG